jgi:hypothetical protein
MIKACICSVILVIVSFENVHGDPAFGGYAYDAHDALGHHHRGSADKSEKHNAIPMPAKPSKKPRKEKKPRKDKKKPRRDKKPPKNKKPQKEAKCKVLPHIQVGYCAGSISDQAMLQFEGMSAGCLALAKAECYGQKEL